jgi:hypothetical protein
MTEQEINKLYKSNNWMIRMDNDGLSHGNFRWNPIGEWTEAPDWEPTKVCGNGLHGQNTIANGLCVPGTRLVLCETRGDQINLENNIKVRYAKIIATNEDIPSIFLECCALILRKYQYKLPPNFTHCKTLSLDNYKHKLPDSFTHCWDLFLQNYQHKLPPNFTHCGYLYLNNYQHKLPSKFAYCAYFNLDNYQYKLPSSLVECDWVSVGNYQHKVSQKLLDSAQRGLK